MKTRTILYLLCTVLFCACSNDDNYPLVVDDTPNPSLEKLLPKPIKGGDKQNEILSFQGEGYLYEKALYLCCETEDGTKYLDASGSPVEASQAANLLQRIEGGSPQLFNFGKAKVDVWSNISDPTVAEPTVHHTYPYSCTEGILQIEDEDFQMFGVSCEDQFTVVGVDGDYLFLRSDKIWTIHEKAEYALFVFVKWSGEEAARHYHI